MKKILKSLFLTIIMLIICIILTGCGKKVVATMENVWRGPNDERMKYEDKNELLFKNGKLNKIKRTFTFENEEDAKKFFEDFESDVPLDRRPKQTKLKGKTMILNMSAEEYVKLFGDDVVKEMTEDELKEALEESGYTIE